MTEYRALVGDILSPLSNSERTRTFRRLTREHAAIVESFGFEPRLTIGDSVQKYERLSEERQWQILADLAINHRIIEGVAGLDPSRLVKGALELKSLKKAIRMFGFRPKDECLFDAIDDGDVIEIYDSAAIQIYRSWNYFSYCRYSLEDLMVNNWSELYARPSFVVNRLMVLAPRIFEPGCMRIAYDIPEYVVTERMIDDRHTYLFKMKYAFPLLDEVTGQVTSFVSTGAIRKVSDSVVGHNVDLL